MIARRIAYGLLVLSIGTGLSLLWSSGVFSPNAVLVEVLATTGGDYGVVCGRWKLHTPATDTIEGLSYHVLYVTGEPNPWAIDYDSMFDYFRIEGEVIGMNQHYSGQERYPLVKVSRWYRIHFMDFFLRKGLSLLGVTVSIILLWRYRRPSTASQALAFRVTDWTGKPASPVIRARTWRGKPDPEALRGGHAQTSPQFSRP